MYAPFASAQPFPPLSEGELKGVLAMLAGDACRLNPLLFLLGHQGGCG